MTIHLADNTLPFYDELNKSNHFHFVGLQLLVQTRITFHFLEPLFLWLAARESPSCRFRTVPSNKDPVGGRTGSHLLILFSLGSDWSLSSGAFPQQSSQHHIYRSLSQKSWTWQNEKGRGRGLRHSQNKKGNLKWNLPRTDSIKSIFGHYFALKIKSLISLSTASIRKQRNAQKEQSIVIRAAFVASRLLFCLSWTVYFGDTVATRVQILHF